MTRVCGWRIRAEAKKDLLEEKQSKTFWKTLIETEMAGVPIATLLIARSSPVTR